MFSTKNLRKRLGQPMHIAPLVTFRVTFGAMMFISIIRFWMKGWIYDLYIKPAFYFPFMEYNSIQPLGATGMYLIFALLAITSLFITIGFLYRPAIILFCLLFTYVELIDITNYLNHYYFVTIVSFLLIWLPANRYASIDAYFSPKIKCTYVPAWTINSIRLQVAIVYIFAGLAKLNYDWLISALPMKIWLPAKSHLPVVGSLMYDEWVAYLFSWFGACYDLFIVFFLINRKTRPVAYLFVLVFHTATAIFFPGIGMFPYIMILNSLVFFSSGIHQKFWERFSFNNNRLPNNAQYSYSSVTKKFLTPILAIYFVLQLLIPLRFLLYPGHLFWTEQGFRFSWRVMLMEKSGNTFFTVKEPSTGRSYEVNNNEFLTPVQEKMMSTQPDMMVQYAHFLAKIYTTKGIIRPEVYVESYVALNGRRSTLFIDSTVDLATKKIGWNNYDWILPFNDKK